ncbi:MAG TPA: TMEM175 family protein [Roseiarcus sp.]
MGKGRLEAFTDAVVAVIITIMVLEVRAPQGGDLARIQEQLPVFLAYVLSYITIGIFWINHHHMLHAAERVDGWVLYGNLNLLFWLSLIPFVIRWMDESGLTPFPVAAYGVVLSMAAIGYSLLERAIIACNGRTSGLAVAVGRDFKGWLSIGLYFVSIPLAFVSPWISVALYIAVALIWFVPDRRIESTART